MVPFLSSRQILLAAKTFESFASHRFPTVGCLRAKEFCYFPFAFIANEASALAGKALAGRVTKGRPPKFKLTMFSGISR